LPTPKKPPAPLHVHELELELKERLTKGILELNNELDFNSYPVLNQYKFGLCHQPLTRLSSEKLVHLLNVAGDARIFTKMNRFNDRVIRPRIRTDTVRRHSRSAGLPSQ
jgi:hypothetical protein